jgi:hypothetical protein
MSKKITHLCTFKKMGYLKFDAEFIAGLQSF